MKKGGKWTDVKSRTLAAAGEFRFGAKPDRLGQAPLPGDASAETNSTVASKSNTVKVLVTRK